MSLAYGVLGELDLELENNFGDFSDWDVNDTSARIDDALNNMLSFADDVKERRQIKALLKNDARKRRIAQDFIKSHNGRIGSE